MSDQATNAAAVTAELDRLTAVLDSVVAAQETPKTETAGTTPPDAIDAELARPARVTAVKSLANAPEIEAFRTELVDGLIRADTVRNLLSLVNTVVGLILK